MITDYNVTACYDDECYENYYRQPTDWDKYYESKEERKDNINE